MDKRTNTPHDDFSVEEILQEARLLREQQGEEITFSVATTDQKPASERAQATPVEQDAKAVAQQPVKEPVRRPVERKEPEPGKRWRNRMWPRPKRSAWQRKRPRRTPIQWTESEQPEEEEPRKLSWAERRAEKKRIKEERRRLKKQSGVFPSEEEDIYYGLQLKPLEEYKQQYEKTLQSGSAKADEPKERTSAQARPVAKPVGDKTGSIFSYLFDSTDEEMDEEIAARFETLHQERKQRMEEAAGRRAHSRCMKTPLRFNSPSALQRRPKSLRKPRSPQRRRRVLNSPRRRKRRSRKKRWNRRQKKPRRQSR